MQSLYDVHAIDNEGGAGSMKATKIIMAATLLVSFAMVVAADELISKGKPQKAQRLCVLLQGLIPLGAALSALLN